MQSPITGPLSLGDLLDRAFRIYRARFGSLVLTAAIFFVPLGILSGIMSGTMMTGYFGMFTALMRQASGPPDAALLNSLQANSSRFIGLSYLLAVLGVLFNGLVTLALTNQAIAALHQQELSLWGGIRAGLRRLLAYIGMFLSQGCLMGFATFVVVAGLGCLAFGLILGIGGFASISKWEPSSNAGAVAVIIGIIMAFALYLLAILLALLPTFYLMARWVAAVPGLVEQQWGPIEALQKSWALTKGQTWRCLGYVLLLGLLYGVIYVGLISVAVSSAALVYQTSQAASVAIYAAVSAVLPVLWQPLSTAAFVLLYYDLRVRQEGYDLNLRVQQLEAEIQPAAGAKE